ncbi:ABC transporter permease [Leifsonia shinshuensis]|uniref:Putative ABC transport system permease protein n=1 Tax=Leifsonia shinshuensis TaxID=150026 RepID=A0A853CUX8_9MICO|nr:ABC transporter permease [Leifsonia shinshuensis]NYJ22610.1 putative ABC transport system permease protein [Leifsonia shinshuensis]
MSAAGERPRSVLRLGDAVATGFTALAARKARSLLSITGIAIAVASLVCVTGLAASAQAALIDQLGRDGNLLTVAAGQTFSGNPTPLPPTAETMVRAIPPVTAVTAVGTVPDATVRRTDAIPALQTNGITVLAAEPSFGAVMSTPLVAGRALDRVAQAYPEVVLGFSAAQNLGIDRLDGGTAVTIDGASWPVVGILAPSTVAPEVDDAALVSFPVAVRLLHFDGTATRIYLRADPDQVAAVDAVLPFTVSPQQPEAVEVRRPSDILTARIAAKNAFVGLYVALAAVALLVGGLSIANVMIVAVVERRTEIGLRRALGARSRHIAQQFLTESALLALIGGLIGAGIGAAVTAAAATAQGEQVIVPLPSLAAALAAAVSVGLVAGVWPALRAARLPPAEALRAGE